MKYRSIEVCIGRQRGRVGGRERRSENGKKRRRNNARRKGKRVTHKRISKQQVRTQMQTRKATYSRGGINGRH